MNQRNEICGINIVGEMLWVARQITPDQKEWEATGTRIAGFLIYDKFKSCLSNMLIHYPDTDTIQGILDGQYRVAVPSNAAAITILDAIARELGQ
jgi:hypothetical protein